MSQLLPLPVVVPLLGAALTLILVNRPRLQRAVSVVALGTNLVVAVLLLVRAHRDGPVVIEVGAGRRRSASCWSPTSSPR